MYTIGHGLLVFLFLAFSHPIYYCISVLLLRLAPFRQIAGTPPFSPQRCMPSFLSPYQVLLH